MGSHRKGVHRSSFEWCMKACNIFGAGEGTEARGRTTERTGSPTRRLEDCVPIPAARGPMGVSVHGMTSGSTDTPERQSGTDTQARTEQRGPLIRKWTYRLDRPLKVWMEGHSYVYHKGI